MSAPGRDAAPALPGDPPAVAFVLTALRIGGSEAKTVTIANALAARSHPVHLIWLGPPETLRGRIDASRVHAIGIERHAWLDRRALARYREHLLRHDVGTVVTVNEYPLLFHLLARSPRGGGRRLIAATNTSRAAGALRERVQFRVYRRLLRRCEVVVFGCERERERWRRGAGGFGACARAEVIYNGVDTARFAPSADDAERTALRRELGIRAGEPAVGVVAQLRPGKGHEVLLAALALVRAGGRTVHALLVGDGPLRGALERRAATLGLGSQVHFLGERADVRPTLAAIDAFVLPSVSVEMFSNAALEAMSAGRAVILSDVGGAREMIEEGVQGHVVPPGDARALATRIASTQDGGRWHAMGDKARERAENAFRQSRMIDDYERLLFTDAAGARSG